MRSRLPVLNGHLLVFLVPGERSPSDVLGVEWRSSPMRHKLVAFPKLVPVERINTCICTVWFFVAQGKDIIKFFVQPDDMEHTACKIAIEVRHFSY